MTHPPPLADNHLSLLEMALNEITSAHRSVESFKSSTAPAVGTLIKETLEQLAATIRAADEFATVVEEQPWGRYNLGVWPKNTAMADALVFSVVIDPVRPAVIFGGWDVDNERVGRAQIRPVPGWEPFDLVEAVSEWLRATRMPRPLVV